MAPLPPSPVSGLSESDVAGFDEDGAKHGRSIMTGDHKSRS